MLKPVRDRAIILRHGRTQTRARRAAHRCPHRRRGLRGADLTGARCQGGVLTDCDLSGAWLLRADLSRRDLRGSDLSALEPENTVLRGAIVHPGQALVIATALGLDIRDEDRELHDYEYPPRQ